MLTAFFFLRLHITNRTIGFSGVRAISQQHTHKANAGKQLSKCTFSQLMTIVSVRHRALFYIQKFVK